MGFLLISSIRYGSNKILVQEHSYVRMEVGVHGWRRDDQGVRVGGVVCTERRQQT